MAKQPELRVVSYVHVGDDLVCTDVLNDEQKEQLAVWIKKTMLGAMFPDARFRVKKK